MNKISKHLLLVLALCTLMIMIHPSTAWANSAEPPSLVILINNPPEDLSIVLISDENRLEAAVRQVAWEGYYAFYSRDMQAEGEYTFEVTTNGERFQCTLGKPLQHYNNVYTLDLSDQELTPGKYPLRTALLVSMRLLLTLFIEGIIFGLFLFRQKRSWISFFAINLFTQGALNLWLSSGDSLMPSYLVLSLMIGEIFVFAVEMIAFPIFVKEYKKERILIYVFIANLISFFVGGYIISVLPV